jgi:hypothetical protein
VFDDMLKKPCPYHKTLVNQTLEQCGMLKKYYSRSAAKDGEAKKDGGDGDADGFPTVENVFLIFGGLTVDMSSSQRKRERYEMRTMCGSRTGGWSLTSGSSSVRNPSGGRKVSSDAFGRKIHGRLSASVRQRDC